MRARTLAASLVLLGLGACRGQPEPATNDGGPAGPPTGESTRGRAGPAEVAGEADPSARSAGADAGPGAARLREPPPEAEPPDAPGREGLTRAVEAWRFVRESWKPAVASGEASRYRELLGEDFEGRPTGDAEAEPVGAESWPGRRTPPIATIEELALGEPRLAEPDEGEATIRLRVRERVRHEDGCTEGVRELALRRSDGEGGPPWTVIAESRREGGACAETGAEALAEAHGRLRRAARVRDRGALPALLVETVRVRDAGLETARYELDALVTGEGRWLLDRLADVEPAPRRVETFGREGSVAEPGGGRFVYERRDDAWRLVAYARRVEAEAMRDAGEADAAGGSE